MAVYTLEALTPKTRCFVTEKSRVPTGKNRNGTLHYEYHGREYFETAGAGQIEISEWLVYFLDAVIREGYDKLYRDICEYCKENCMWLKSDDEINLHAAECLCHGSYKHWDGFRYDAGG
ncbi:MAG: hypothetical protein K6G10_01375 [Butyrivibrio sp.]|nr:hypothetical protein [Butyrivibrio sp.]